MSWRWKRVRCESFWKCWRFLQDMLSQISSCCTSCTIWKWISLSKRCLICLQELQLIDWTEDVRQVWLCTSSSFFRGCIRIYCRTPKKVCQTAKRRRYWSGQKRVDRSFGDRVMAVPAEKYWKLELKNRKQGPMEKPFPIVFRRFHLLYHA